MDEYWTKSNEQSEFSSNNNTNNSISDFNVGSDDPISTIIGIADRNNAWSAEQAQIQRDWQEVQNEKAMNFNSAQAALNRDWQKMMSDTAHQREVLDLQRAGLNPVLSASGGNGASVGSGATASGVTSAGAKGDTDESVTGAVMSWMANLLQAQTAILNTSVSAQASMANAGMMAGATQYAAQLQYDAAMSDPNHYLVNMLDEAATTFIQNNPKYKGMSTGQVLGSMLTEGADTAKKAGDNFWQKAKSWLKGLAGGSQMHN